MDGLTSSQPVSDSGDGSIASWDAGRVVGWLRSLDDPGLADAASALLEQDIDGATLLEMKEEELVQIGFNKLGPRKRLLRCIQEQTSSELLARRLTIDTLESLDSSLNANRPDSGAWDASVIVPASSTSTLSDWKGAKTRQVNASRSRLGASMDPCSSGSRARKHLVKQYRGLRPASPEKIERMTPLVVTGNTPESQSWAKEEDIRLFAADTSFDRHHRVANEWRKRCEKPEKEVDKKEKSKFISQRVRTRTPSACMERINELTLSSVPVKPFRAGLPQKTGLEAHSLRNCTPVVMQTRPVNTPDLKPKRPASATLTKSSVKGSTAQRKLTTLQSQAQKCIIERLSSGRTDENGIRGLEPNLTDDDLVVKSSGDIPMRVVVCVDHCQNCHEHHQTTRHDEAQYQRIFHDVRNYLLEYFSGAPFLDVFALPPIEWVMEYLEDVSFHSLSNKRQANHRKEKELKLCKKISVGKVQKLGRFEVYVHFTPNESAASNHLRLLHSKMTTHKWPSIHHLRRVIRRDFAPRFKIPFEVQSEENGELLYGVSIRLFNIRVSEEDPAKIDQENTEGDKSLEYVLHCNKERATCSVPYGDCWVDQEKTESDESLEYELHCNGEKATCTVAYGDYWCVCEVEGYSPWRQIVQFREYTEDARIIKLNRQYGVKVIVKESFTGTPCKDARVTVLRDSSGDHSSAGMRPVNRFVKEHQEKNCDANGCVHFILRPGRFRLSVRATDCEGKYEDFSIDSPKPQVITVELDTVNRLVVQCLSSSARSDPLSDCDVTVSVDGHRPVKAKSSADGFCVFNLLKACCCTVECRKAGFRSACLENVQLNDNLVKEIVTLSVFRVVYVKVIDKMTGSEIRDCKIEWWKSVGPESSWSVKTTFTDINGVAAIECGEGAHSLSANVAGCEAESKEIDGNHGDELILKLDRKMDRMIHFCSGDAPLYGVSVCARLRKPQSQWESRWELVGDSELLLKAEMGDGDYVADLYPINSSEEGIVYAPKQLDFHLSMCVDPCFTAEFKKLESNDSGDSSLFGDIASTITEVRQRVAILLDCSASMGICREKVIGGTLSIINLLWQKRSFVRICIFNEDETKADFSPESEAFAEDLKEFMETHYKPNLGTNTLKALKTIFEDEGTTFDHIFLVSDGVPSLSGGAERVLKAAESFITRASATVRKKSSRSLFRSWRDYPDCSKETSDCAHFHKAAEAHENAECETTNENVQRYQV